MGHTHKLGSWYSTSSNTMKVAYMNGHLSDPTKAVYTQIKNWQQGFSVVSVEKSTGWFRVEQIPIVKVPGSNAKRLMLHEGILETKAMAGGVE
jgi:hypothetical protein